MTMAETFTPSFEASPPSFVGTTGMAGRGQSYGVEMIERLSIGSFDAHRVRYYVKIDGSYRQQSHITAEVWMPERGWVEVIHLWGEDRRINGAPTGSADGDRKREFIDKLIAEHLRPVVAAVLS